MKKVFFENLDGLRFIAFSAIFVHHGVFTKNEVFAESGIFRIIEAIKSPAALGIPFFFCLSGFLITYLLLVEKESFGKIHIGKFYIRRILRIWPLYYAVVIFGFFIFPIVRSFFFEVPYIENATLWKYLLFLSNFDQLSNGMPHAIGLGVTWSLSVEEQFYLFWPLLLVLVNPKYYLYVLSGCFIIANVLMHFYNIPYSHTLGSMSDLSIGALLALLSFKNSKIFQGLANVNTLWIVIFYLLGFAMIYLKSIFGIGHRFFVSLFMTFVIWEQCFSKGSLFKMGSFKTISYLGTLTYSFYLLHVICIHVVFWSIHASGINLPPLLNTLVQAALSLLLVLLLGYLSFNFYEKPFLKYKSKFSLLNTSKPPS